jgi:hypothetical protein
MANVAYHENTYFNMETKFYKYFAKESDVEAGFEQTLKLKDKVEGIDQILINSF